jgi:hypothetical protein
MGSTNVGDPDEQARPDYGQYADLAPVIESFRRANSRLDAATRIEMVLNLAATRLLESYAGPEAVQFLRGKFPALFEELDRLDAELAQQPATPAPPLPAPVPVEAPSIIFRGPGPAD